MPQPNQGHYKNLPTLELSMNKPGKTCMKPTCLQTYSLKL